MEKNDGKCLNCLTIGYVILSFVLQADLLNQCLYEGLSSNFIAEGPNRNHRNVFILLQINNNNTDREWSACDRS